VAGYTNFTADADHPEAPMREIQVAYVAELARLASDIGAPIVRVFTGYERDDVPFGTQWDWCVTALRECAVRADSYGVSIAIQNHHDIAVTAADLVDLIQEIHHPRCGAAFDAWAPALQGLNVERETERIAPYVIHTTVADYELRPRFGYRGGLVNYQRRQDRTVAVPVGQGVVDYAGFLGVLRSHGYEGYVAYEMCSELVGGGGMDRLDRCARGFLDFMNTLPARAERRAE
jgi:sugar phosphate isomerase/epimerase